MAYILLRSYLARFATGQGAVEQDMAEQKGSLACNLASTASLTEN